MVTIRDSNPRIPNPGIPDHFFNPESRAGDALIPGLLDYEKRTKCPNFT